MKWEGSWAPGYRRAIWSLWWTLDQTSLQRSRTVAGVFWFSKLLVFHVCRAVSARREFWGSLVSGQKQLTFIVLLHQCCLMVFKECGEKCFVCLIVGCNVVANLSSPGIIVGFVCSQGISRLNVDTFSQTQGAPVNTTPPLGPIEPRTFLLRHSCANCAVVLI